MNVHADLSFVAMVTNASFIVQAVMALLAVLSLWSWWQIFQKMFQLSAAKREADRFEDEFWKGGDLAELFQKAAPSRSGGGLEHIFSAGFREYSKHRKQGSSATLTLDAARRAMRAAYQREIDALEAHLSGLASVGSVSPDRMTRSRRSTVPSFRILSCSRISPYSSASGRGGQPETYTSTGTTLSTPCSTL